MLNNKVKKDKTDKNDGLEKSPKLWRISIGDVNCFTEIFNVVLTSKRLGLLIGAFFVLALLLGIMFVAFTPVKSLLPGFIRSDQRNSYEELLLKYDSLSTEAAIQNDYLENIVAIFSDSVATNVPSLKRDTLGALTVDSIIPASEAERNFVKQYEQREKYNLSVLSPIAAEGMTFYVPVVGARVESVGGDTGKGIVLITPSSAQVSSIYRGTVIAESYVVDHGITVVIQHPQDFISIYSGLSASYVTKGDKVNAGTRIGIMSASHNRLSFELWHSGTSLNPQEYIAF